MISSRFMHPDWDMFQSGHLWGAFHAAGRAVSGGPVYCSDKPGEHDFALLQKLVCSDGSVLRCDRPGLPTLDTLCHDPTAEDLLFKIQNRAGPAALLGVFHCRYLPSGAPALSGSIQIADALNEDGPVACFAHNADVLEVLEGDARREVSLSQGQFELFSLVPIVDGFAAIGLADKFNSPGAIVACERQTNVIEVSLRDGGVFVAYSQCRPSRVLCDGAPAAFSHQAGTGRLEATLVRGARRKLVIVF